MTDLATDAVHAGRAREPVNRPAASPLYESAGWSFEGLDQIRAIQSGEADGVVYGSYGGPNHDALERLAATLHRGEAALCANGGMTAIAVSLRHLTGPGERILAARDLFGPTLGLLTVDLARAGVRCELVDATDLAAVSDALSAGDVSVLFVETISNPRLRVADIAGLALLAHRHGARLVVDNTFASPAACRPLALGADLVVESLTKYVAGHYDCLLGVIVGTADQIEAIRPAARRSGQLPGPFQAWLCVREAQTFPLRFATAQRSAERIARWLEGHDAVEATIYPALESHPDHDVAARTLPTGAGAVVSFELAGGAGAVERMVRALRMLELVSSLGGVRTTVNHPTSTSHRDLDADQRRQTGVHDGLVRLAVGIESLDDILADLAVGLEASIGERLVV